MTREEVREVLQEQIDKYGQEYDDKGIAALEMAIKALEQEPCEDAVSRKEVLNLVRFNAFHVKSQIKAIENLPSVTSTRKKGRWVKHDTGHSIYYDCSLCGCVAPYTETADKILWKLSNYCPDCGAEMESEE